MKQDFAALGKLSVHCLVEHLNGGQSGTYKIQPTFIERKSTLPVGLPDKPRRRTPLLVTST
jgi:DNA-binding LacI/PurR family transcriptional regulator